MHFMMTNNLFKMSVESDFYHTLKLKDLDEHKY